MWLPRIYLLVFGAASAIGPYIGGLPGLIVIIVAVTLGIAYALLGLAVAHICHADRVSGFPCSLRFILASPSR